MHAPREQPLSDWHLLLPCINYVSSHYTPASHAEAGCKPYNINDTEASFIPCEAQVREEAIHHIHRVCVLHVAVEHQMGYTLPWRGY